MDNSNSWDQSSMATTDIPLICILPKMKYKARKIIQSKQKEKENAAFYSYTTYPL